MTDLLDFGRRNAVDLFLVLVFTFGGFACMFGAANWNDHLHPIPPRREMYQNEEEFRYRQELFKLHREQVGQAAVLPWVFCAPVTFAGLSLSIASLAAIIARGSE